MSDIESTEPKITLERAVLEKLLVALNTNGSALSDGTDPHGIGAEIKEVLDGTKTVKIARTRRQARMDI
jgi:hypothetical protein